MEVREHRGESELLLKESNLLIHYGPKKPITVACDAFPFNAR